MVQKRGTRGASLFRGDISVQPREVVDFNLGNYGLSSKKLFELFEHADKKYREDENRFIAAKSQNTELLPIDEQYIENAAIEDFSYKQTLRYVLKSTGTKNFEEYKEPVKVLQQQKDRIIRLRDIIGGEITDLLDSDAEDIKKAIKERNEFRNHLDVLISIFNDYIRDTQSRLVDALR